MKSYFTATGEKNPKGRRQMSPVDRYVEIETCLMKNMHHTNESIAQECDCDPAVVGKARATLMCERRTKWARNKRIMAQKEQKP